MHPAPIHTIEIRPNRDGKLRAYIGDTRIRVLDVYALSELQGLNPDEIAEALPQLSLADVHAALAFYFANREQIVSQLREEEDLARKFRAMTGPGPMEAKLQG
jgi:uncharacterized protein (DUF433 family)